MNLHFFSVPISHSLFDFCIEDILQGVCSLKVGKLQGEGPLQKPTVELSSGG